MKRLSLALTTLSFSSNLFAALPAATMPTEVSVPQLDGGFFIGFTGDYLQPNPTHGDLDFFGGTDLIGPPFNSSMYDVEPSYQWGWGENIGFIFPHTGNDINLSYSHLGTNDSRNLSPSELAEHSGGTPPSILTAVSGNAQYTLNQVDLTVGQFINLGCRWRLHPNAGLRWAGLERKLNTNFAVVEATTVTLAITSYDRSDFNGIGPLAGLDASYYLGRGFGAVAHIDSALLIGDIDDKKTQTIYEVVPSLFTLNLIANVNADSSRIVPVTDAKLGLDYSYLFNDAANSYLTLEVGWQASQYYNAVDKLSSVVSVDSSAITERSTSRVGFNGPYASLILHV